MVRLRSLIRSLSGRVQLQADDASGTPTVYSPLATLDDRNQHWRRQISNDRQLAVYDRAVASVDRSQHAQLQHTYRAEIEANPEQSFTKYLDLAPWFMIHSEIAVLLDLDQRDPISVLDIGSGGGHFLAMARALGHRGLGFDMAEPKLYGDLLGLFGVERIEGGVYLAEAFPKAIGRFDLITINAQIFDVFPKSQDRWRAEHWAGFLKYLCDHHLNYPGEIYIGLNRSANARGEHDYNWPLLDLAEAHGATVYRERKRMHFRLTKPLRFPDIAHEAWEAPKP